jgi:hypothetical protein
MKKESAVELKVKPLKKAKPVGTSLAAVMFSDLEKVLGPSPAIKVLI